MKSQFIENEAARVLITIREDDLCWFGQDFYIGTIPEGALVRVFIPANATHADEALEQIRKRALSVTCHYMPKAQTKMAKTEHVAGQPIRDLIKTMVLDVDLNPLIDEALASVGL